MRSISTCCRRVAILSSAALILTLLLPSCGSESTPDVDQGRLDELEIQLWTSTCLIRMDSISFEIEGLIFHSDVDITDREAVMALVPDDLPTCPLTEQPYIIEDAGLVLVITCPIGHGSIEID